MGIDICPFYFINHVCSGAHCFRIDQSHCAYITYLITLIEFTCTITFLGSGGTGAGHRTCVVTVYAFQWSRAIGWSLRHMFLNVLIKFVLL